MHADAAMDMEKLFGAYGGVIEWERLWAMFCMMSFQVSVQIATYNRPSLVLEALQQIEVQDYAGKIEAATSKRPLCKWPAIHRFVNWVFASLNIFEQDSLAFLVSVVSAGADSWW